MRARAFVYVALVGALVWPRVASAQTPAEVQALREQIEQLKKDFGDRLAALEASLASAQAVPPVPVAAPEAAPIAQPSTSAASGAKFFNPDMAVIGNFLGAAGRNEVNPSPALEMRESEASFQAVVDPYARADFFLAFGEEGVELEEGFLTFTELPGRLLVKVGKMRAAVGKVHSLHTDVLPWADRPLVTTNLVGGEDGIADARVSVARLIPNPWIFLGAAGQVFRGDSRGGSAVVTLPTFLRRRAEARSVDSG